MERFSLAGGQGWLTVEESGGRARCAAELPEDGKGLYKGYLCGTGGRALLGTKEGDTVTVEAPRGAIVYTVKKIER